MKKLIVFLFILTVVVTGILLAQKKVEIEYDAQWKKIEELAEKQLPESALKETELILKKAKDENNVQQLIKATVYKMRFTLEKEPDKAPKLLKEFETFTEKTTDKTDNALLNSMLAELYANFYQANQWIIDERTEVYGTIPDDINEWTKNIFYDKISSLVDVSLADADLLQKTDAHKYDLLLEKGDDSKVLQPSLFDFLAQRKIEILESLEGITDVENPLDKAEYYLPADEFVKQKIDEEFQQSIENKILTVYQQVIAFHLSDNQPDALIYIDLQRLDYVNNKSNDKKAYLKALEGMENKFQNFPAVVEVLANLASYYQGLNENEEDENADVDKTALRKAYDICAEGIKRFPEYKRINLLKNIQTEISRKKLSYSHKGICLPSSKLEINISFANIDEAELKVYKLDVSAIDFYTYKQNNRNDKNLHPSAKLIETKKITLKKDENFLTKDTLINLPVGEYGIYQLRVSTPNETNPENITYSSFTVTSLSYIARKTEPEKLSLYTLDRKSGLQIPNVTVNSGSFKWNGRAYDFNLKLTAKTDKNGFCLISGKNEYSSDIYFFESGNDKYFSSQNYQYYQSYSGGSENVRPQLTILTDRSLYRPGQTVYFKGISYFSSKNKQEVNKNASYEVTLLDANYQKISSKKFKTNEFGSFAGEFVLPSEGLNGAFTLRSEGATQTIWVEEYKRPTFEVKIPKPVTEIRFGENVTVKGNVKAFAGYDIANAKVKYRVMQQPHFYCWWLNRQTKEISSGSLTTDANGNFEINFTPEKPKDMIIAWRANVYSYTITADVTQQNGETQKGEMSFSIGDKALFVNAKLSDMIEKSGKLSIPVSAETINGERVSTIVSYTFFRLEKSEKYIENNNDFDSLKIKSKIAAGTVNVPNGKIKVDTRKWESGVYRLVLTAKDKFGVDVKSEYNFVLFAKTDKKPAYKTYEWLSTDKTECVPNENAVVRFGTSTKNTMVLFELMQGNIVLESKWIKFNDEIKTFTIPFKESFGEGVNVQFTFIKDEKLFTKQITLSRKVVAKHISPKFSVFRDKLQPGQHETWTVTIPGTEKKLAELVAAMYDASLDMIRPHDWYFAPEYTPYVANSPNWSSGYENEDNGGVSYNVQFGDIPEFQINHLNWFGLNIQQRNYRHMRMRGTKVFEVADEMVAMDMSISEALDGKIAGVTVSEMSPPPPPKSGLNEVVTAYGNSTTTIQKSSQVKPRTNFAETAFFYPQLKTDVQGNVKFSFTAPESLTRWNVKLLAHTPDLYYGSLDTTAATQKDVMVQMNLPRFVRRSDKLTLSANVINLSDKDLQANVTLNLIDPTTEKEIKLKNSSAKSISFKANETTVVEWELSEFSEYELVICKIIAEAGNFSDGEQKYLPVLPDKVLITESLPLTIRGNQTRTFNFQSLQKNAVNVDNKSLTVEFSSNPAWYAVQALPTLSAPENDNALDLFTAYYVNSLAGFIANSNPKIAKIFDQWKNAKGGRDALLSNLQQNAELKNMLLEETPWVMAAKDETEQKRQIALLFELNMQKNQAQQYLDKLLKLQQPDGGFTWFDGMPSSRYITQEILLNFARLNKMTGKQTTDNGEIKSALAKALNYLDLEISHDFSELKKYNKNYQKENCVGNIQLFYLHTRSEYPEIPVAEVAKEAVKYYTSQSEKFWTTFTLYGKAMMALVAHRNGKTKIASDILKSLKENAMKTDEFGMYWAKNTAGYFWNERPVAVQAGIIEAFAEISKNTTDIDELKIWLLKQKQTQRWDSPVASVNAIYALLLQGSDWLANDGKVKITAGSKLITPAKVEAGTGYFKETIPVNEIRPETGKITVEKTDKNIGWGAVYWQYYQEQDKVQNSAAGLKITKKLFVKEGAKMLPFEQVQVKKGDKIVTRLVITSDRNLEYVALKDLRAACFEPVEQRSTCHWKESVCYYQTTKDASTQFFFSFLPKGTYVFEYELWANNAGTFTSGIASVQCQYAPEFVSYAGGEKIVVGK